MQEVVGYDANALYLLAIGQEMPEGSFVIRKSENEFRPQIRDPHMQAFNWLNYVNRYHNKRIKHKRNSGRKPFSESITWMVLMRQKILSINSTGAIIMVTNVT